MLNVKITPINEKIVIEDLGAFAENFRPATMRGLERAAAGIFELAHDWLSGPGGGTVTYKREWSAGGEVRRKKKYGNPPGGYPVPVRTGHLRRSLAWLGPGESKTGDVGSVTAGDDEFIIFNSASYALAVFLGLGSSSAYGPRDAIADAFMMFNHGGGIQRLISEEVRKEIHKNDS